MLNSWLQLRWRAGVTIMNNYAHINLQIRFLIYFWITRYTKCILRVCSALVRENGHGWLLLVAIYFTSTNCHSFVPNDVNGQVRLGGSARNYFLYVQFRIRLAAVSYHGKKVRTAASPAVGSVNKSRDTRNCVQNEPVNAICVILTTRLYYKAIGIILYALIWQIRHSYNRLDDGHCNVTGHHKMSALRTASVMVTTHENSVMMWSFEGPKFFSVL